MINEFSLIFEKITSFVLSILTVLSSLFYSAIGYEKRAVFNDSDFKNGFTIVSQDAEKLGNFTYSTSQTEPSWMIAQWNSGKCLWENRVDSDGYTITDGETKWFSYNPNDGSVKMRLNASNVYNGLPADDKKWPHLLLEQSPIPGYSEMSDIEKSFYSCNAKRLVLDLDIRIDSFKDTINKDGINAVQYLAYFYLKSVDSDDFIWFGINLFDSRGNQGTYWSVDTAGSNNMIYTVSDKDVFGAGFKSLIRRGKPYVSDSWSTIHFNLTSHIAKLIKQANKDEIFGRKISAEDFYIAGANIGFEIHGNYDCTVSIKNFSLTSYN